MKKRAAWKPGWPSVARKVQWRFQRKLLVTATQNAPTAEGMWCTPSAWVEQGEDGEVDDVAGAADHPELEQLDPVLGLAGAEMDPTRELPGPVGGAGRRVTGALRPPRRPSRLRPGLRDLDGRASALDAPHPSTPAGTPANGSAASSPSLLDPTPKCSSTSPATSRSAHCVAGLLHAWSNPQSTSGPERVARQQRAVAAAADVGGAAPVDALVARRSETSRSPAFGALQRRPQPPQRVGIGARCRASPSRTLEAEHAEVAVEVPAVAAPVARPASPAGSEAAAAASARRPTASARRRRRAPSRRRAAASQRRRPSSARGVGAPRAWARARAVALGEDVDAGRAGGGADRELGRPVGLRRWAAGPASRSPSASASGTRSATSVWAWSAIRITACSSQKASMPAGGVDQLAEARSAWAIESTDRLGRRSLCEW